MTSNEAEHKMRHMHENHLTFAGRYDEGLIRQRSLRLAALNTQTVASKKLAYTS